jgi:hypothetical protein
MPMKRELYPPDWEEISRRIRFERAAGKCEATMPDGSRCNAPHGEYICRLARDKERWVHGDELTNTGAGEYHGEPVSRAVRVCLTVAHIDHDTTNNADDNLAAWCQLHHLRHDAGLHARNAAATRRRKSGAVDMFE